MITYLWNPLSLKNTCHFLWFSFNITWRVCSNSGVLPGHKVGDEAEGGRDGVGKSSFCMLVDMMRVR